MEKQATHDMQPGDVSMRLQGQAFHGNADFVRRLTDRCRSEVQGSRLFQSSLRPDICSGDVFPAIRNDRVDFYYRGGKLFSYASSTGFVTHIKYASVITGSHEYVSEGDLPHLAPIRSFSEQYSRIKENCGLYSGLEAQGVSRLLSSFGRAMIGGSPSIVPLDIEICFDSSCSRNCEEDSGGRKLDRIDILFYNTSTRSLRFCEAKHFTNPEIWARPGRLPEVVHQLVRYRRQIEARKCEILAQYKRYIALLDELLGLSLPDPVAIDELPIFLLVFGFDSNQRDGRLKSLLLDDGSLENEHYYFCGDVGKVKLSNMWAGAKNGPGTSAKP